MQPQLLRSPYGSFRKFGVAYFGVLIIRFLLFRVILNHRASNFTLSQVRHLPGLGAQRSAEPIRASGPGADGAVDLAFETIWFMYCHTKQYIQCTVQYTKYIVVSYLSDTILSYNIIASNK